MEEIIKQAPSNMTTDDIKLLYEKNNFNVIDTLIEIWNIDKEEPKPLKKFDEIRNLCDEYDSACYEYLRKSSKL
jgi:hypothetical protein